MQKVYLSSNRITWCSDYEIDGISTHSGNWDEIAYEKPSILYSKYPNVTVFPAYSNFKNAVVAVFIDVPNESKLNILQNVWEDDGTNIYIKYENVTRHYEPVNESEEAYDITSIEAIFDSDTYNNQLALKQRKEQSYELLKEIKEFSVNNVVVKVKINMNGVEKTATLPTTLDNMYEAAKQAKYGNSALAFDDFESTHRFEIDSMDLVNEIILKSANQQRFDTNYGRKKSLITGAKTVQELDKVIREIGDFDSNGADGWDYVVVDGKPTLQFSFDTVITVIRAFMYSNGELVPIDVVATEKILKI